MSIRKVRSAAVMAVSLFILTGCTGGNEPQARELPDIPVVSPEPVDTTVDSPPSTDRPEGGSELVEPDVMPVIIPRSDIPPIEVFGDFPIGQDTAEDVYEWAAALAWFAINDQGLRHEVDEREELIRFLLPYLTDDATQQVLSTIREWADSPNPYEPEVLVEQVNTPMFFVLSPDGYSLGDYENNPIYSNVKVHNPTIEKVTNDAATARYDLTFDVTAMVYLRPYHDLCEQVRPQSCGELFYLGMSYHHEWSLVETGDSDAPYALDTWNAGPPVYGNPTQLSDQPADAPSI